MQEQLSCYQSNVIDSPYFICNLSNLNVGELYKLTIHIIGNDAEDVIIKAVCPMFSRTFYNSDNSICRVQLYKFKSFTNGEQEPVLLVNIKVPSFIDNDV